VKTVADPAVLDALKQRLAALQPVSQRRWGTLTAHEMVCHLADSSDMVLKTRPRSQSIPARRRLLFKFVGLWTPFRWPHGWRTNPRLDPRVDGTKPSEFIADRNRALAGLVALAHAEGSALEDAHGVFGRMSTRDWQRFAYKHTDHHLRQFGL
jgi:hypothetical protein